MKQHFLLISVVFLSIFIGIGEEEMNKIPHMGDKASLD